MVKKCLSCFFAVCAIVLSLCGTTCSDCYYMNKETGKYIWMPSLADSKYSSWMWGMPNNIDEANEKKETFMDEIDDRDLGRQKEISENDPVSADVYKKTPGYADIRAMVISGNGIQISGLIKLHGAVYSKNSLLLQDGAVVEEDIEFISDMRKINMQGYKVFGNKNDGTNPPIYSAVSGHDLIPLNPVSLDMLPSRIKLLNPQETEVDDSVFTKN